MHHESLGAVLERLPRQVRKVDLRALQLAYPLGVRPALGGELGLGRGRLGPRVLLVPQRVVRGGDGGGGQGVFGARGACRRGPGRG